MGRPSGTIGTLELAGWRSLTDVYDIPPQSLRVGAVAVPVVIRRDNAVSSRPSQWMLAGRCCQEIAPSV